MTKIDGTAGGAPIASFGPTASDVNSRQQSGHGHHVVLPPVQETATQTDVPALAPPKTTDSTGLLMAALAVRIKNGDQQLKSSVEDVRADQDAQRAENKKMAKALDDQIKKMNKSKSLDTFLKALTWIGVGVSVLVAAITLNPVAIAGAVMAVNMAVLNETGTMDKMSQAMAKSLQKDGMSETESQKWAMGLTMAIGIAASLASVGAGAAASTTTAAAKAAEIAEKLAAVVPKLAVGAKATSAVVTAAQAGTSIDKGVVDKDLSDKTADIDDMKAYLAKLKAASDDEVDRIQAIVQEAQDTISRTVKILGNVNDSNAAIVRHTA